MDRPFRFSGKKCQGNAMPEGWVLFTQEGLSKKIGGRLLWTLWLQSRV